LEELGLRRRQFALEERGVEVMQATSWTRPQESQQIPFILERSV
jgi:hypothetical protein